MDNGQQSTDCGYTLLGGSMKFKVLVVIVFYKVTEQYQSSVFLVINNYSFSNTLAVNSWQI